jgi:hypothetical protein
MQNMEPKTPSPEITCFYLMNGQIIFAELVCPLEQGHGYMIQHATMVMIGQAKQLAMSTAYPFTNIDDTIELNADHVTGCSSLDWNTQLVTEYGNFWTQLRAKAAGIIIPGDAKKPGPPLKVV